MAVGDIHGLKITDIPAPAKKRPRERMPMAGVDGGRKRVAGTVDISGPWGEDTLRYDGDEFEDIVREAKKNMQGQRGSIIKKRKNPTDIEPVDLQTFKDLMGVQ